MGSGGGTARTNGGTARPDGTGGSVPADRPLVMRVYSRLEVGGIEHQMLNLLPRLDRGRYRVELCLLKRAGEMADWLRERGVAVHVVPIGGRLAPGSLLALARLFKDRGVTIVHSHVRESNTTAAVAARLARVPVVIGSLHNMDTIRGRRRILQDRLVHRLRDGMVAVSERVRRNYIETVGVPPETVSVIYNGVDITRFDDVPRERNRVLGPLGFGDDDRVVICVARLVPQKAQEVLLAAAAKVLARVPSAGFLLVGEGKCEDSLRAEAQRLGVASHVVFAGKRDDVPSLLRASDVSALTSTREGFSNVLIESLAAGLPVVATDVGGNAEAVEDGVSGFIVPPGDVDAVADRMIRLLGDDALRSRMSRAAGERAVRFGLEQTARETEALYDRLLRARGIEPPG